MTPPELLCKKLPLEFSYYFHYCTNLKFEDRPDYTTLKTYFANLLTSKMKIESEFVFDWFEEKKEEIKKEEDVGKTEAQNQYLSIEYEVKLNNFVGWQKRFIFVWIRQTK